FNTYWIVQYHQELYIIDQHAAHEKVLYEKWMQAIGDTSISAQMLLEPLVLDLSDREYEIYKRHKEDLEKLGFLLEEFGQNTILVKSVPYLLNQTGSTMDFVLLFDQLNESSLLKKEDHYAQELASIACKAAIKGNDKLSVREYQQLIEDLLLLEDPYYCPHKRPTMIRLSQYELEKKFKRKV
ncbi:MAG: DNA mismatch repair protein MutL, partial [Vallitaleaceae bacterium]|nr:DNA mismatch repair protein MutL [Vallitaleaceae bacterium]